MRSGKSVELNETVAGCIKRDSRSLLNYSTILWKIINSWILKNILHSAFLWKEGGREVSVKNTELLVWFTYWQRYMLGSQGIRTD